MKIIIFISPPAAGKGTISYMVSKKYNLPHISVGQILREKAKNNHLIQNQISNGNMINDDLVVALLKERTEKSDCQNGYILDGFPRTLSQAKLYDEMFEYQTTKDVWVFVLEVEKELAKKRVLGRYICTTTGEIFNENFINIKDGSIYDMCNGPLVKRSDDTEETFEKRFRQYEETSKPLISYYEGKNQVHYIEAGDEKEIVFAKIERVLDNGESNNTH